MKLEYPGIEGNGEIYLDVVKAICGPMIDGFSMVDLGCHKSPYNSQLGFSYKEYVDIQNRPLDDVSQQKHFICKSVFEYMREKEWRFTTAIASDFIEHLPKSMGFYFLGMMEKQSYRQILFTPRGPYNITEDDHPDSHKSGWHPVDFIGLGYCTIDFPDFHGKLKTGAFFAFRSQTQTEDFERVKQELNNKPWTKLNN